MNELERILNSATADSRLQTIINNNVARVGCTWHFVNGYAFDDAGADSPAFCIGIQIANYPLGFIFIGRNFARHLTAPQLEYVTLHEMDHIMKNHFFWTSLILLAKTWIIDRIAEGLKITRQRAISILDGLKILYIAFSGKKTIEETTKAQFELEADQYAVMVQREKQHAISTLLKMSNADIRAPTHVTSDGIFPFLVITCQERIDAINKMW